MTYWRSGHNELNRMNFPQAADRDRMQSVTGAIDGERNRPQAAAPVVWERSGLSPRSTGHRTHRKGSHQPATPSRSVAVTRSPLLKLCFALVMVISGAKGQTTSASDAVSSDALRKDVNKAVLQSLREGDLPNALKALESSSDGAVSIALADSDPLSQGGAALHRALAQLSSQERFDLLNRWSISVEPNPRVRQFVVLVPTVAPPSEFARVLGERPRAQSFAVASIGGVRGVFSTGWELVIAARESGRLKRLMADLRPLVDKRSPNAELLMMLAQIADGSGDIALVAEQLKLRTNQLMASIPQTGTRSAAMDSSHLILAAAAAQHPSLRPLGRTLFETLIASTAGRPASRVLPFLRESMATMFASGLTDNNEGRVTECRLKYWTTVSGQIGSRAVWQLFEDHVAHLSGAGSDMLMLRYPLQGDFEFSCDVQSGGRIATDGGLSYGGLQFLANSGDAEFSVLDSNCQQLGKRSCPFVRGNGRPKFDRLLIATKEGAKTISVNQHPMWTEKASLQSTPWLALSARDGNRSLFRNLKITGKPTIPREVRMAPGNLLRGWQSDDREWRLDDGVIHAPPDRPGKPMADMNHLLSYQRPLFAGESISYQFLYQPGVSEASPALGRVAFLLQPDGVRIHWVTDGDWNWTGLNADNAMTEPLNRRGPRPLPLKRDDWNQMTLTCTDQVVTLSLNDVIVYQQPINRTMDLRFGLYRHPSASSAEIRNVVMKGDWSEIPPQEFLDNPIATTDEPLSVAERHALGEFFPEDFLVENVVAIRRRSLAMPVAERFEFLSQWILPGPDHPGFRICGDFTPTRPSPLNFEPGVEHPELGGQIVSPVFDWLDAARELGKVSECRRRVEGIAATDNEFQNRARTSLLLMISLETNEPAPSDRLWENLLELIKSDAAMAEGSNHWPELLLATRSSVKAPDNPMASELILDLAGARMFRWRQPDLTRWHNHLAALQSQLMLRRQKDTSDATTPSTQLRHWIPVAAGRSVTFGSGNPNLKWIRRDNKAFKVSGHDVDFLYYRLPLSGNFQVEADLVQPHLDPVAILVGGNYAGPLGGLNGLNNGSFRAVAAPIPFEKALTNVPKPVRYRAVVQDGVRTISLNGRKVLETQLPNPFDPWIAIRCPGRHQGPVLDVRITGNPIVLNVVPLSTSNDLTGWMNYHEEGVWVRLEKPDSRWIVGHPEPALAGTWTESLLRYQRPLVENGSIEYEFFYEPGVADAHPALDRLAFILHPSGVREHWITDGRHGPIDANPANVSDIPENRRGPSELPLLPGKWNRFSLTIREATVTLHLNGTLVYERVLEPENQRMFGLFHYVDATEVRVRNATMRGDWPNQLPALSEQELAGRTMDWMDADLPRLKSVFTHSFEKEGLPEKYFQLPSPNPYTVTPDGIQSVQESQKDVITWEITPRFSLSGDFDIEVSFAQAKLEPGSRYGGLMLRTVFDEPQKPVYDLHRIVNESTQQLCQACQSFSEPTIPGNGMWRAEVSACEADSGRLRLARRGTKLYYLLAEGDSPSFRQVHCEDVSVSDLTRHGVRLQNFAFRAKAQVVWKNVTLRAERMNWYPVSPKPDVLLLKTIQADGTGMRTIRAPSSAGFTHVGSPEWSPDGRKIAVDMSQGSTTTSHIVVMNADGSGLQNLGRGCMPSFSGDSSRIAFSDTGQGIMTMKSDGTDRQVVDRSGWGTQWSPDGKWIAYGKAGNVTVRNVATGESHELLVGDDASRYSSIFWNLAWSHDSRKVAFKARRSQTNQEELAVAWLDPRDGFTVLQADATATYPDIAFSPDNEDVIASMNVGGGQPHRLHSINIKQPGSPKLLEIFPPNQSADGIAWSPDGKTIAFTTLYVAEPEEWISKDEASK